MTNTVTDTPSLTSDGAGHRGGSSNATQTLRSIYESPALTVNLLLMAGTLFGVAIIATSVPHASLIKNALYSVAFLLELLTLIKSQAKFGLTLVVESLLGLFLLATTVVNGGSISSAASTVLPMVAFSLLGFVLQKDEIKPALKLWIAFFGILIAIDALAIAAFPNGLYAVNHQAVTYTGNWILGYKSHRILYALPLLAYCSLLLSPASKKLWGAYAAISILTIADACLCEGATLAVSLALFALLSLLELILQSKQSALLKLYHRILDYRVFFTLIIILFVVIVLAGSGSGFLNMLAALFSKSPSLGGRTAIWDKAVAAISGSPLYGLGVLSTAGHEAVLSGGANAHSQFLTVLLFGGIPALILYLMAFLIPFIRWDGVKTYQHKCLGYAIFSFFVAGLISSIATFAPHLFLICSLMERFAEDE